jgi:probable HAF family extracellular repeat protein
MTDLGNVGYLKGQFSQAEGINARGQVVGDSGLLANTLRAFLIADGRATDLGILPGTTVSNALAINDLGQVVGTSVNLGPHPFSHAFLYADGRMTDLGTLGGSSSAAEAIN